MNAVVVSNPAIRPMPSINAFMIVLFSLERYLSPTFNQGPDTSVWKLGLMMVLVLVTMSVNYLKSEFEIIILQAIENQSDQEV